ncbi:MAG: XRE family transcriptional regulator [Chromatiales bacterium]|nr:XRE family transcriptional regulator [Chromatiales bacterium]
MKTLKDMIDALPADQQKTVAARVDELIAEELTLQDLRKAQNLTQKRMAELLGIGQDNVSRMENRSDMLLSTMRSYIAAMGGELDLIVRFPDRPAVALKSLFDTNDTETPNRQ